MDGGIYVLRSNTENSGPASCFPGLCPAHPRGNNRDFLTSPQVLLSLAKLPPTEAGLFKMI